MSAPFKVPPERAAVLTRFAAITAGALFGVAGATFAALALVSNSRAAGEEALANRIEQETAAVREVLDDARSKVAIRVRSQSKAISDFQQTVTQLARSTGCTVEEFISSTEVQPYLTRFAKQGQVDGWSQIEIQVTLTGQGRDVFEAVSQLADQPVPIEFNTVQLVREGIDERGASIKAKMQLRVLVQSTGATS